MANKLGRFTFPANYNVVVEAPLDTRSLVDTVDDLISENSWPIDTHPPYKGMLVSVASTGDLYILLDPDKTTDINSWKRIESSGSTDPGTPNVAEWNFWKN